MHDFDVAIVGGGPAGAATALFLCATDPTAAERVVLIDKAQFPREKICAGAIGGRALRALAEIGVPLTVPNANIRGLSVSTGHGSLREHFQGADSIGCVVRRSAFDASLLEQVRERGVSVREGVKLEHLRMDNDGVTLSTSADSLKVRAVIGADGVASRVRRCLKLPPGEFYARAIETDTPWCPGDATADVLHFDLRDDSFPGYSWDFPTVVDGESLVCRGIYELRRGAPSPASEEDLASRLRRRLEYQGLDPAQCRFKQFAERGLSLRQACTRDRVLLVGEAAGIDPVLGEGIAQAVLYGKMAGRYLSTCMATGSYHFKDYPLALKRSRVGLDLRIRSAAVRWFYGAGRSRATHWLTHSRSLAMAGMHYFAGERVPRHQLLTAGFDLLRSSFSRAVR